MSLTALGSLRATTLVAAVCPMRKAKSRDPLGPSRSLPAPWRWARSLLATRAQEGEKTLGWTSKGNVVWQNSTLGCPFPELSPGEAKGLGGISSTHGNTEEGRARRGLPCWPRPTRAGPVPRDRTRALTSLL